MADASTTAGGVNSFRTKDSGVVTTLVIKAAFVSLFLVLFLILRKRFKWFYQYRYELHHKGITNQPRSGLLWIPDTIRYRNRSLKETTGLDGYMYLRNLRALLKILLILMVVSAIMLYPTNYYGGVGGPVSGTTSMISMSNVLRGSSLLWIHFVFGFIVTGVILWFVYKDYKLYTKNRIELKRSNRLINYAILLKDIPRRMFTQESISNYFRGHLANQADLKDISLIYPIKSNIYGLLKKRNSYVNNYEKAIEDYKKTNEKSTRRTGLFGLFGRKRDALDYNKEEINQLTKKIENKREIAENTSPNKGGAGFVVFNQRNIQKEFVQTIMHSQYISSFSRYNAPDPNDVYWKNINVGYKQYWIRTLIVTILLLSIIFLSAIPVALISGWANVSSLSQLGPFSWVTNLFTRSVILQGILTGFAPNLVLFIFVRMLGPIIKKLCTYRGFFSNSRIEAAIFSTFWLYLVFNVFFISAIAGTIFQSLNQIVSNPTAVITWIAISLGGLAYQMINFIIIATAASASGIIRWKSFIVSHFKLKFLCKTNRQIDTVKHRGPFSYGVNYAKNLLVFHLSIAYSTLNPFILPFGVLYFITTYLVHKHNIVWVNTPDYNANGIYSPMCYRRMLVSLIIYHILMIGTFNVYRFFYGTLLLIPLIFTLFFWYALEKMFKNISKHGIMDDYEQIQQSQPTQQAQPIKLEQPMPQKQPTQQPIQQDPIQQPIQQKPIQQQPIQQKPIQQPIQQQPIQQPIFSENEGDIRIPEQQTSQQQPLQQQPIQQQQPIKQPSLFSPIAQQNPQQSSLPISSSILQHNNLNDNRNINTSRDLILNPLNATEFHDATHSIYEYNDLSYKPPYYHLETPNSYGLETIPSNTTGTTGTAQV